MYLRPAVLERPSGPRHISTRSQDTNASAIAESTISYGESLSQFPQPPASIPTTPILSEFGSPSPSRSTFSARAPPLMPQRKPLPVPGMVISGGQSNSFPTVDNASKSNTSTCSNQSRATTSQPSNSIRQPVSRASPYDWHDGASSIGMDATEDRLLPTSFITSLLQENAVNRKNSRASYGSDALSGFSEMTYPPLASSYADDTTQPSLSKLRFSPHRSHGNRPPPSAFNPIQESTRFSSDSATLYSTRDHNTSKGSKNDTSHGGLGSFAVGNASANTYFSSEHDLSRDGGSPLYSDVHPFLPHGEHQDIGIPRPRRPIPASQTRESMHSTKSAVPSFISRISSHRSIRRILAWRMVKPLPPVPLIPHMPIATELEQRRVDDMTSLPDLANRADTLEGFLEKGYHPHRSATSHLDVHKGEGFASVFDDTDTVLRGGTGPNSFQTFGSQMHPTPTSRWVSHRDTTKGSIVPKKRQTYVILGVFLAVCLAAVGTAVGITVGRKTSTLAVCQGSMVGAACNLNSTCVCTSHFGQCNGLAQNIIELVPSLNRLFLTNLTNDAVYNNIWLAQGSVPGSCASQSLLVDVAPALTQSENITEWAQTALLWNLVESQNLTASTTLQKFIQTAPWSSLDPVGDTSLFSITVSGYIFDFAAQQVTQPNVSFVTVGQPNAFQVSKTGRTAQSALDRMYSFASASSTQHQKALENYWVTVLQQKLTDLPRFISAVSVSPILLPFDATLSQGSLSIHELLTPSPSSPFPPPLGCYPKLNSSQIQQINAVEGKVFGLPPISSTSHFDPACYPDRPIYGILDVLRLRLPFLDSKSGVAKQAAILKREVSPRVIVRNGVVLSPLPGPSNASVVTAEQSDPRRYGALGQFNHVILQYLVSIPEVDIATALVSYVLSSINVRATPPSSPSILFKSVASIPVIEVAIFGSVTPSDVSSAVSSFTTSSGGLFFGSDQGTSLRDWVITGCGGTIAWAESPLSPLVVPDSDFSDQIFNETWVAVSTAIKNGIGNIGLINITDTFTKTQKFTPYSSQSNL